MFLVGFVAQIAHALLMLAAGPVLVGFVRRIKARLLGHSGPSVLQPWRDILRLMRKQRVLAENASPLFRAAPVFSFAAIAAAALLVPSFTLGMTFAPISDIIVIAGMLTLSRCIIALAGMDVGTAFGGIGASREMAFATFAEPALLLVIFTLALLAGATNLDSIAALFREGAFGLRVSLGLALIATVALVIAENARIPVDNPATHLELTMVHEAMVLEYSGSDLALIEWGTALKLLLSMSLIAAVFFPFGIASAVSGLAEWAVGLIAWAVKIVALGAALGLLETVIAKMRVFRVPEFLGIAVLLGLLAAIFLFVSQGFA